MTKRIDRSSFSCRSCASPRDWPCFKPSRKTFPDNRDRLRPARRRCRQECAAPPRYLRRLRSTLPAYLRSARRAPACRASRVSLAALAREDRRIDALAIVPDPQAEFLVVVADLHLDLPGLGMPIRVAERLGGDLVDLIPQDRVQLSRLALDGYAEFRPVSRFRAAASSSPRALMAIARSLLLDRPRSAIPAPHHGLG